MTSVWAQVHTFRSIKYNEQFSCSLVQVPFQHFDTFIYMDIDTKAKCRHQNKIYVK